MSHAGIVWAQPSPPDSHGPVVCMDVDLATLSLSQPRRAHYETYGHDGRRQRQRSQTLTAASVPVFAFTPSEAHTVGPASRQHPHSLADPTGYRLRAHSFSPAAQHDLDGGLSADADSWVQPAASTQQYAPHRPSVLSVPGQENNGFAGPRSGPHTRLLGTDTQSRSADDLLSLASFNHTQVFGDPRQPPIVGVTRSADTQHELFFPHGAVDKHAPTPVSRVRALTSADVLLGRQGPGDDFAAQGSTLVYGTRARARGSTVSGPLLVDTNSSTHLGQTVSADDFSWVGLGCPSDRYDPSRQPADTGESVWEGAGAGSRGGRLSSESATGPSRLPAACGGQPCSVSLGFVHNVPLAQFEAGLGHAGNASRSMQVLALVYRSRALRSGKGTCRHCLLLGCLVLADKYLHDVAVPMAQWAAWAGLPVQQVCAAERHVLWVLAFELYVPQDEFNGWVLCFLQLHYRSALQQAAANPAPQPALGPRTAARTLSDSPLAHRSGPVRAHGLASRSQLLASPSRRHTPLPTRPYPVAGGGVGRRSVSIAPGQGRASFSAEVEAIAKLLRSDCTVADTPPHPFARQPNPWPQNPVDFASPANPAGGY